MARISLGRLASGYLSVDKLNSILEALEVALDRTLFRDGQVPNSMTADLDMAGKRILNSSASASDPQSVPTFGQVTDYVNSKSSGLVAQKTERIIASPAQTVFTLTTMLYQPNTNNLAVYVNGVRKFVTFDFTETSSSVVTFLVGMVGGEKVDFVTNDYVATISTTAHTHTWAQITGVPVYTTRWPTWDEVTGKPTTFPPSTHLTNAVDIVWNGVRVNDEVRGVFVQASQPTTVGPGDFGYLWFF